MALIAELLKLVKDVLAPLYMLLHATLTFVANILKEVVA
ncbi:hypothetical protein QEC_3796, partial [Clostridioides difficile CD111]